MTDGIVARGTDGKLYKLPQEVAEKHVLEKEEAQQLFDTRSGQNSSSSVSQSDPEQVPDFHVLLQMEYV